MDKKVDWIYHYVANGVQCADCGEVENGFPKYVCDAHTHGMTGGYRLWSRGGRKTS